VQPENEATGHAVLAASTQTAMNTDVPDGKTFNPKTFTVSGLQLNSCF